MFEGMVYCDVLFNPVAAVLCSTALLVGMLQRIQNATIISRTLAYHSSQPHQDTRAPSARAYLNDVRHHRNQSLWMAYRG